jgi:hypothetical protein
VGEVRGSVDDVRAAVGEVGNSLGDVPRGTVGDVGDERGNVVDTLGEIRDSLGGIGIGVGDTRGEDVGCVLPPGHTHRLRPEGSAALPGPVRSKPLKSTMAPIQQVVRLAFTTETPGNA